MADPTQDNPSAQNQEQNPAGNNNQQQQPPAQQPNPANADPNAAKLAEAQSQLDQALARIKEFENKEEQARKEREEADKKKLEEQGNYKDLLAKAEQERDELKAQVAKRDREALLAKVAAKHKLPAEMASRLQGESEADLEKDAEKLAKIVQSNTPVAAGNGPRPRPAANPANPALAVPPTFRAKF